MFADYTTLILRCYEEKRRNNTLSLRLVHPTPAQLKEECEVIFSEKYDPRDRRTLTAFFGEWDNESSGLKAIQKCDIDKFRPLVNYMLKKTRNPQKTNIELLAWLIDFKERPFVYGKRYNLANAPASDDVEEKAQIQTDEESPVIPHEQLLFTGIDEEPATSASNQSTLNKKGFLSNAKVAVIATIILILTGAAIYLPQKYKPASLGLVDLKPGEACMYWTGDHYEQVSCIEKHGDTLMVALDTFRLIHLRKINRPDTITQNAIGKVWYIKTNGTIEYFTSGGYYPLDPKRKLNPITPYIIRQHISNQP